MNDQPSGLPYPEGGDFKLQSSLRKFSMIIYAVLLGRLGVKQINVYQTDL